MAIAFTTENGAGVPVTYWNIARTEIHHRSDRVLFWLAGYISEAARRANKSSCASRQFIATADQLNVATLHDVTSTILYQHAMSVLAGEGVQASAA